MMMEAARGSSCQVVNASLVDLHSHCPLSKACRAYKDLVPGLAHVIRRGLCLCAMQCLGDTLRCKSIRRLHVRPSVLRRSSETGGLAHLQELWGFRTLDLPKLLRSTTHGSIKLLSQYGRGSSLILQGTQVSSRHLFSSVRDS